MDTSLAFLGLVEAHPGHGYELKRRYDDYFGSEKPLAYGQVYAMLGRLVRDGLIEMDGTEDGTGPSRKLYRGLDAGRDRVLSWLGTADADELNVRSNLFAKVVIALLMDVDAPEILATHRHALLDLMRQHTRVKQGAPLLDALAHDHTLFRIEADLRWIDLTESRLTEMKESLA